MKTFACKFSQNRHPKEKDFKRMYGLVNKAVHGLIVQNYGEEVWEEIKTKANVETELFISNESYPDNVTYDLLVTAAGVLEQPASKLLNLLGHYWISDIAVQHYGSMMDAGGDTLKEFLHNLPNFHRRVRMIFPNLEPPIFHVQSESENRMDLVYESKRNGLENFVIGLLEGLGNRYAVKLKIEQSELPSDDKKQGVNRSLFVIQWE